MRRRHEPPSPDRDPRPMPVQATPQIVSELAPTGVLRAAINMGNFLLVTGKCPNGDPSGVSPDMAAAIGARLGVPVKFIPYARPGEIADDAEKGAWDIGNIGAEPQRAAVQQAGGTPKRNAAGFAFLRDFVEEAKKNGLIASLIERHGTVGRLSVAPPA